MVIGTHGHSKLAAMLLGSVAEKMVVLTQNIPLMIVKQKDENFDFWNAINKI